MRGTPEQHARPDAQLRVGDREVGHPPGEEPVQRGRGQQHPEPQQQGLGRQLADVPVRAVRIVQGPPRQQRHGRPGPAQRGDGVQPPFGGRGRLGRIRRAGRITGAGRTLGARPCAVFGLTRAAVRAAPRTGGIAAGPAPAGPAFAAALVPAGVTGRLESGPARAGGLVGARPRLLVHSPAERASPSSVRRSRRRSASAGSRPGMRASVAAAAVCSCTPARPNRRSSGPEVTSTSCIRP